MRVAVAGGTGVVGRHVVQVLQEQRHEAVVLARSAGVDLVTGSGLQLDGVDAVVDCANIATLRRSPAERFFATTTRTLVQAGARAGVRHHVVLSIVGIDRVDTGYYAGKRRQEAEALAGEVPVTVVRATQFHEFAGQVLDRGAGPVRLVPRMRVQPVAAREAAEVLVEVALGEPAGRAPDLGGPDVHELADLARRVAAARGVRVLPVRLPGGAGRAMAGGALLPGPGSRHGRTTFDDWLAAQD